MGVIVKAVWIVTTLATVLVSNPTKAGQVCSAKVCRYQLNVHRVRTMTYVNPRTNVTHNVRLDGARLHVEPNPWYSDDHDVTAGDSVSADDVITADGYRRNVIAINGRFPGPTVEVMEGTQVDILRKEEEEEDRLLLPLLP